VKPPWGRITAIDLNKGDIVWQVPHGETPDYIRNHPALKHTKLARTGQPGMIGTLVTKTLLIAGDGGVFTSESGARIAMLRAYDKATGVEVGAVPMPASQTGSPMTYALNGKQYIVLAIGEGGYRPPPHPMGTYFGELIAFRLP
jgi:quinoprotein glucose dehydrogenase